MRGGQFLRNISPGWVIVSALMIAGGFLSAAFAGDTMGVSRAWLERALFFIGAFIGGFFAGRASPGRTIVEPGLAAVLVVLILVALRPFVRGSILFGLDSGGSFAEAALHAGFPAGLGGFVGAMFGERTAPAERPTGPWRWWGISVLVAFGMSYAVLIAVSLFAARQPGGEPDQTVVYGAAGLAAFLNGFIVQAIAPRPMAWVCAAGPFGVALAFIVGMTVDLHRLVGELLAIPLVVAIAATVLGAFGALLGWRLIGSRRPPPSDLPEARVA